MELNMAAVPEVLTMDTQPETQPFKSENGDEEINNMANQIRMENKIKMNFLKRAEGHQKKVPAEIQPPKADLSQDWASKQGQFGWCELAKKFLPYLIRSEEKYVAFRILEIEIYPRYATNQIPLCFDVERTKLTKAEAKLLNEINSQHCDYCFGTWNFTDTEDLIKLTDAIAMHEFFETCHSLLVQRNTGPDKHCGFVKIASENVLPYVWFNSKQYVPLFYLDGEVNYLEERSLMLRGWELAYLKLLCKISGVKKPFFDYESVRVVDLEVLKQCFAPDTLFEETWPVENKLESLLRKPPASQNIPENKVIRNDEAQTTPAVKKLNNALPLGNTPNPGAKLKKVPKTVLRPAPPPYVAANPTRLTGRPTPPPYVAANPTRLTGTQWRTENTTLTIPHAVFSNLMKQQPRHQRPILILNSANTTGCRFFQVPEVYFKDNERPYFILGYQMGDTSFKHCINLSPFDTTLLLVTLQEIASELLKIQVPLLKKALEYLRFDVFLPNTAQKKALHGLGIVPVMGLISLKDVKNKIAQLRNYFYLNPR